MSVYTELKAIILECDAEQKCSATHRLFQNLDTADFAVSDQVHEIPLPGYPHELQLVPPRALKRRGIQTQTGRNVLMHAIAHIEFNAINLALDAAYRFRGQPRAYYQDWLRVADDEARHFLMIRRYLLQHDSDYGQLPAHNGLWEMAIQTQDNVVARMALVPRVLEARGLDVTPNMIKRLTAAGDQQAADILERIYQDEIEHVRLGSHWFKHQCEARDLDPFTTFTKMVDKHLHGELRGPFNLAARLKAGFKTEELQAIEMRSTPNK